MANIKITLIGGKAGILPKQRATLKNLGLGKIGSYKVCSDTPANRGMVRVVEHLVKVEEV